MFLFTCTHVGNLLVQISDFLPPMMKLLPIKTELSVAFFVQVVKWHVRIDVEHDFFFQHCSDANFLFVQIWKRRKQNFVSICFHLA